jgi:hypothetical protein
MLKCENASPSEACPSGGLYRLHTTSAAVERRSEHMQMPDGPVRRALVQAPEALGQDSCLLLITHHSPLIC